MVLAAALLMSNLHADVSEDRLRVTLTQLATYPTRNTNTEYLTHSAEWIAGEFRKIPGMQVELMKYPVKKGRRRSRKMILLITCLLPIPTISSFVSPIVVVSIGPKEAQEQIQIAAGQIKQLAAHLMSIAQ